MEIPDTIQITVHDVDGAVYNEFRARFDGRKLFDTEIVVLQHLQEGLVEYVVVAVLLTVPWKVFKRVVNRFSEDIGDRMYERLRSSIRQLFKSTGDSCRLAIEISRISADNHLEISIRPIDLRSDNIDAFLVALSGPIADILFQIEIPTESTSHMDIEFSIRNKSVSVIKAVDWTKRQEFTYDLSSNEWRVTLDLGPPQ